MTIDVVIASKNAAQTLVEDLLEEQYSIPKATGTILFKHQIKSIIDKLIDDAFLLAETHYVDKVYRDSYYSYYSTKLLRYSRNCIRISIFKGPIDETEFRDEKGVIKLAAQYLGYFVLRPTDPAILGRNLISPLAFKNTTFSCVTASFSTTCNGVKFNVQGFPHSSQDAETITCAETTIWALMEYFSHKYPEYSPVLPSKIIQTLNRVSSERQIPSKGLNIQQMSFAMREFGFGTRIYSKHEYKGEFNLLLSSYIESGVPLIIALNNYNGIGHALLCIGRKQIENSKVDALATSAITLTKLQATAASNGVEILDFAGIERDYVFVDDNHAVYQVASLDQPTLHYDKSWHTCEISFFIAPLYQKLFLEAFQARNYLLQFLIHGPNPLAKGSKIIMRLFLASSRTMKDHLSRNGSFNPAVKDLIVELPMPKFVWICELTDKALLKQKKANGIIILDATEANIYFNKPLIFAAYQDNVVSVDSETKNLENYIIPLGTFLVFEGNLKSF